MCGIAGIWRFNNKSDPKDKVRVKEALEAMHLRGPDNASISHKDHCTLGHVRLSIIDTSPDANQPFTIDGDELVFNGEIFNYKELRKDFNHHYNFRTNSDTEVLCKKLATEDTNSALNSLNGFFSFAFLKKENATLHVARDRYGIKPLYYFSDEEKFCFASELKGLLKLGVIREINKNALNIYLHLNYIPAPLTIFNDVYKLEPGNYIRVDKRGIKQEKYYTIEGSCHFNNHNLDYEKAKAEFRLLLNQSVEKRMISDVPLGCFLSGGIDSSVITGIAAGLTNNLRTFSIGFKDEPYFDETEFAELVAKKHKTNHTTFKLSNQHLYENLYDLLDYLDEPFADSSALNLYILSKETKKTATVALSGDGADELLAGYNKHRAEWLYRKYKYASPFLKSIQPFSSLLPQSRNNAITNKIRQGNKFIEASALNYNDRYWRLAGYTNSNTNALLNKEYESTKPDTEIWLKNLNNDFNSFLITDQKLVLEGDMLVKADRMSMANSLEIRVPFLDYHLVNYTNSLPSLFKIDANRRKKILVDSCKDLLPETLLKRKKQGFEVPLLKWFRNELKPLITQNLLNEQFIIEQGIFNYIEVKELVNRLFSKSPGDAVARIWGLIVFQHWYKKYYLND